MNKIFYVCSYDESGLKMLGDALTQYGDVKHVYSRNPPNSLEYVGNNKGQEYYKLFNGIKISDAKLDNYYVIFIYRNPVKSILSHLKYIQPNTTNMITNVITEMKDLYDITEFYNNYTTPKERNYPIHCIRYEEIFEKQNELSQILDIGPLHLVQNPLRRHYNKEVFYKLYTVYLDLIKKMDKKKFIEIIVNTNNENYWKKFKNKHNKLCFIHTPKCGGTYVISILKTLGITNKGHNLASKKDGITFTVIRDPIERFESLLNYRMGEKSPRDDWPNHLHYVFEDKSIDLNEIVDKMSNKDIVNFKPYRTLSYWNDNIDIVITIDNLHKFLSFFGYNYNVKEYNKKNVSNKNRGIFNQLTINRLTKLYSDDMILYRTKCIL